MSNKKKKRKQKNNKKARNVFDTEDDFLLIKFIREDLIDSVFDDGLYFAPASSFWGVSNDPSIDDKDSKYVTSQKCHNVVLNGKSYPDIDAYLTSSQDLLDVTTIPICCFAHATLNNLDDLIQTETLSSNHEIYKFSDTFINDIKGISKGRPFILCSYKDLIDKFNKKECHPNTQNNPKSTRTIGGILFGEITYLSYYKNNTNFISNATEEEIRENKYVILFRKELMYADQHEFRFALLLNDRNPEPFTLKLDSLLDITNKYTSDVKLNDFKFIYDKKLRKFKVVIVNTVQ